MGRKKRQVNFTDCIPEPPGMKHFVFELSEEERLLWLERAASWFNQTEQRKALYHKAHPSQKKFLLYGIGQSLRLQQLSYDAFIKEGEEIMESYASYTP